MASNNNNSSSDESLSLRTWELLSIMTISETVDAMSSSNNVQHETSDIKKLVKSFLPQIPDPVKPIALPTIIDVYWYDRPIPGKSVEIDLPPRFHGKAGNKFWFLQDCEDPETQTRLYSGLDTAEEVDLSAYGLVQCILKEDVQQTSRSMIAITRRTTCVVVLQVLSFKDFPKYLLCHEDWRQMAKEHGVEISSSRTGMLESLDYHRSTPNFHYVGWDYDASTFNFDGAFLMKIDGCRWYSTLWLPKSSTKNNTAWAFLAIVPPQDAVAMGLHNNTS